MDVKKLGKISQGGGWRAHGRAGTTVSKRKRGKDGYDMREFRDCGLARGRVSEGDCNGDKRLIPVAEPS
jgi:hypothetical protein